MISYRWENKANYTNSEPAKCNNDGDDLSHVLHCCTNYDKSCILKSDEGRIWQCATNSTCST